MVFKFWEPKLVQEFIPTKRFEAGKVFKLPWSTKYNALFFIPKFNIKSGGEHYTYEKSLFAKSNSM